MSCQLYLTRPGLFLNPKREINMRAIKNIRYSWEPHYVTLTGCICFGNTVCHHLVHSILESSCEIIHGHNVVNVGRNKFFSSSNFRVEWVAYKLRISPEYQSNGQKGISNWSYPILGTCEYLQFGVSKFRMGMAKYYSTRRKLLQQMKVKVCVSTATIWPGSVDW